MKTKKLPHINALEHYQFITFRTNDSVDSYIIKLLNDNNLKPNHKQYQIDNHLDTSQNGAYLHSDALQFLYHFLKENDNQIYELISFVIMPNHLHILFKQNTNLQDTMRIIKSKSAREINTILGKNGKFWANDYYDKVIRDEEHFIKVHNYIKNNAPKAGLSSDGRYYSKYES